MLRLAGILSMSIRRHGYLSFSVINAVAIIVTMVVWVVMYFKHQILSSDFVPRTVQNIPQLI